MRGGSAMQGIDTLLSSAMKDVVAEYPEVGTVLARHGVGEGGRGGHRGRSCPKSGRDDLTTV